jgi:hypothetical protein
MTGLLPFSPTAENERNAKFLRRCEASAAISTAVDEPVELAHDIYCRVFRKVPKAMEKVH